MSLLDKVQFWKKHEEAPPTGMPEWNDGPPSDSLKFDTAPEGSDIPNVPAPGGRPIGSDGFEPNPPGSRFEPTPLRPTLPADTSGTIGNRDVELILSRLDTVKAQLEALNTRVAHLERIAEGTQPNKGW